MTPTKDEMFIQTDEAVWYDFVGPPFTFSFRLLAVNCGAVHCMALPMLMVMCIG